MEFIQARNYTRTNGRSIRLLVNHTMETPEGIDTAETVARWFAGSTAPQASPHFCLDANSVVQCVREQDVAWAAPGANHDGIQLEHAGRAAQTASQWSDDYSRQMLDRSARLQAQLCIKYGIPARYLSVAQVADKKTKGICGHVEVTKAFGRSTHWDPGPNFPRDELIRLVRKYMAEEQAPASKPKQYLVAYLEGGKQIGRGYLISPAFVMRISGALRDAGHRPPYTAHVGAELIAQGRFWPPGEFTRRIRAACDRGHLVSVNDTVIIALEHTPLK